MINYIKSFFRNEKYIFEIICVIVFIIFFLQVINGQISNNKIDVGEKNTISEKFSDEEVSTTEQLIENFITLCKNERYEEAYELLTEDCKKEVFENNFSNFNKEYCKKYLIGLDKYYKNITEQKEDVIIYKIQYYQNALETGKTSTESDYISIVMNKDEVNNSKLNIAGFIKKQDIIKEYEDDDTKILITKKNIYKDHEIYDIEFINKTNQTMNINYKDIEFRNSQIEILRTTNENIKNTVTIMPKESIATKIKINKDISSNNEISYIYFNNINIDNHIKNVKIKID